MKQSISKKIVWLDCLQQSQMFRLKRIPESFPVIFRPNLKRAERRKTKLGIQPLPGMGQQKAPYTWERRGRTSLPMQLIPMQRCFSVGLTKLEWELGWRY